MYYRRADDKLVLELVLDVLLQTTESLLRGLENVIVLAHSKAKVVFSDFGIRVRVKLSGRDRSHTNLMDQEPAELEVTRTVGNVLGELVVFRELDGRHVRENEVATFRVGVLKSS